MSGKSLSTNFKMLSIEENGYLTLEKAVLLDGILSFDAYELNLYAGVEAEAGLTEEDINNPNTGTNPLYLLFGIMVCGASAALAIGCTYCKRRRMVR